MSARQFVSEFRSFNKLECAVDLIFDLPFDNRVLFGRGECGFPALMGLSIASTCSIVIGCRVVILGCFHAERLMWYHACVMVIIGCSGLVGLGTMEIMKRRVTLVELVWLKTGRLSAKQISAIVVLWKHLDLILCFFVFSIYVNFDCDNCESSSTYLNLYRAFIYLIKFILTEYNIEFWTIVLYLAVKRPCFDLKIILFLNSLW